MLSETLELGSAPVDEGCAQLSQDNQTEYAAQARIECRAFINQLSRLYHDKHGQAMPHGVRLRVKSNSHDFGTYYEVAVTYDCANEDATDAAFWLEQNLPLKWDPEALEELQQAKERS
jgi:hypothetical protein